MCDTFVHVHERGVLFAKNSDRDPNEAQVLSWLPAAGHAPGSTLHCTWQHIAQVPHTHAAVLSRPFWMWGAEMGVNEHGVAIGNEAIFAHAPLQETGGLTGMDLVRLGLERAATARAAVEVIRELVARHGQGGRCGYARPGFRYHNSFLVADRGEAWVVEAVGRESEVEQVQRGVRAISNGLTLPGFRPRRKSLHERVAMAVHRRLRTEDLGAAATSAGAARRVLSDHGGDGAIRWHWSNGAMAAPCMHAGGLLAAGQTTASWISELGSDGDRHWATGSSSPCLSLWRPVKLNAPIDTGTPTGQPDERSLWWRHERINRRLIRHGTPAAQFALDREQTQAAIFAEPAAGWDLAEVWLARQESVSPEAGAVAMPWWLRGYWRAVDRQARSTLLAWRDA